MPRPKKKREELVEDYLDIDKLVHSYTPLIRSIYKKFSTFNNLYYTKEDYEDLESQVSYEFIRLCSEYNPTRGVDFPGFIKFHLQQRVYHYITKLQRSRQKETVVYHREYNGDEDDSIDLSNSESVSDEDSVREFERIEALASLNWDCLNSEKHKSLVKSVLCDGKTIEEIAKEEGSASKAVRLRLYAVCGSLIEYSIESDRIQERNMMKRKVLSGEIKREPVITRIPIFTTDLNDFN